MSSFFDKVGSMGYSFFHSMGPTGTGGLSNNYSDPRPFLLGQLAPNNRINLAEHVKRSSHHVAPPKTILELLQENQDHDKLVKEKKELDDRTFSPRISCFEAQRRESQDIIRLQGYTSGGDLSPPKCVTPPQSKSDSKPHPTNDQASLQDKLVRLIDNPSAIAQLAPPLPAALFDHSSGSGSLLMMSLPRSAQRDPDPTPPSTLLEALQRVPGCGWLSGAANTAYSLFIS